MEEMWEEVEEGKMPLWFYLPTHPEARIKATDREILKKWLNVLKSEEDFHHE